MVSKIKDKVIGIVGLGYVGYPLLTEFIKHYTVVGFDVNKKKVEKYATLHKGVEITSDPLSIRKADVVIIAVPTPVTKTKQPDLYFVESAARIVGQNLKKGAIVVLESTVYPGVTEDVMGPILEKESGMVVGKDFKIGYSPERVNPGDTEHTIDKITKVVSGMDKESADVLAEVYGSITTVYMAEDIKTAEAAKVIENTQRDLNIALMNELSIIFHRLGLNTKAVLNAASTKWNFNRYYPGLVGGHCIPVDPYYLVFKVQETGYHPQVILAGRAVNDSMPKHVADLAIKALNEAGSVIKDSKVLIMGLTFKENVDDTRETPTVEIIKELKEFKCEVYGYDPMLSLEEIKGFGVKPVDSLNGLKVNCVIITVMHDVFKKIDLNQIKNIMNDHPILIDVRGGFREAAGKGFIYRSL
jgi:UDPglucose 6-dehydrogenase/UDP-N-acetyl-D-galactosamine dehydrogenase